MTPERERLEERLKELMAAKKTAKGVDDAAFVKAAVDIVALLGEIARLPESGKLTDFQVSAYCWALEAVAGKAQDAVRRRDAVIRLVHAYRKAIDSPKFWGDPRACDFGKTLFNAMVTCLHKSAKDGNAETRDAMLRKVASAFTEILSMRAAAFLDDAGFRKEPISDAQRAAMARNNGGKTVRMTAWPSVAEKAFGILYRCLKADSGLQVPASLVDFLYGNRRKGEWLGFYCANAMVRMGRYDEARPLLVEVVWKNPETYWGWTHLAEACRSSAQEAVACLCRSLTCRIHDPEIAKATAAKTHRRLAQIFAAMGDAVAAAREAGYANGIIVSADDSRRYSDQAKIANRIVFGTDVPVGGKHHRGGAHGTMGKGNAVRFSGVLVKPEGKDFGFVKSSETGDVFVPPQFAAKMKNRDRIAGMAVMREDKKKKRMSLCMISDL